MGMAVVKYVMRSPLTQGRELKYLAQLTNKGAQVAPYLEA